MTRALAILFALLFITSVAHAQSAEAEARALLVDGSNLFKQEQYQEALAKLERSYELVPSPNSSLMIARCLVKLERPIDALERFEQAEREAAARLAEQPRYRPTVEAARTEGAAVRATLGAVRVRVADAPAGTNVELGEKKRPLDADGEALLLGTPGASRLVVRMPNGKTLTRDVELEAGREARVTLDAKPPKAKPAKPAPDSELPWQVPVAIAAGGVAVVAFGLTIGFGVHNLQTYDRLKEACSPRCGPEHAGDIEDGERAGVIANVSLTIGLVAVATGATFVGWYLIEAGRTEVAIGPNGALLRSRF